MFCGSLSASCPTFLQLVHTSVQMYIMAAHRQLPTPTFGDMAHQPSVLSKTLEHFLVKRAAFLQLNIALSDSLPLNFAYCK